MNFRSLTATLAVLLVGCLFLIVAGCDSSATEDIFGGGDGAEGLSAGADGTDDDESTDEDPDEDGDDPCDGVDDSEVVESIEVPAGEVCTLNGTTVVGDVTVGVGATLTANGILVGGNVRGADGGASVFVGGASEIRGDFQLARAKDSGIEHSVVGGTIELKQNLGALSIAYNTVHVDVKVFENTGGVSLISNSIANILACTGNVPAPTGQGNTAADKQDQCSGL